MDLPDDILWASYELSLENIPPVTSEISSPGLCSPLPQVAADTLLLDDFSLLDVGGFGFLPFHELENEPHTLGEISTTKTNNSSENLEISYAQNDDFQELFGSDFIRNEIENKNDLREENSCTKVLHPHKTDKERRDTAEPLFEELMDRIQPESLYSNEELECGICTKKCATLDGLKEHYQTCYLEMIAEGEGSNTNLEEEITVHFPDIAIDIRPDIAHDNLSPENSEHSVTSSKTELTLTNQKSRLSGKVLAENGSHCLLEYTNKSIPELFQYTKISAKPFPVPKKANLKRSYKTVYECSICSEMYEHKQPLICHLKKHTVESQNTPNLPQATKKLLTTNVKTYPCMFCGRTFSKKNIQIAHHRTHNGDKPYMCDICLFSCSQLSNLKRHKKSHCGLLRPFTCTICSRKFTTKQELDVHSNLHDRKKAKMSSRALVRATVAENTSFNLKTVPPGKTMEGVCEDLNDSQETNMPLLNSWETAKKANGQPKIKAVHKCSICSKEFQYKSFLKIHSHTHSKERPFLCSFCPKNYPFVGQLKRHLQNHNKAHCCTFCRKKFYLPTELQSHIQIYHEQIRFLCMYCGKGFPHSGLLVQHEITHVEKKPFECHICPFSCNQESNLKRHLQSHLGSLKSFTCMTCNQKFALKEELIFHCTRH